jgi:hypothetical protein
MKIEFRAATREINLGEYDGSLDGGTIAVWVNVTREIMTRMRTVEALTEADFLAVLRELWNPPGAAEAWPAGDILALRDHCLEQDPRLWIWVTGKTWELIMEYQGLAKKK